MMYSRGSRGVGGKTQCNCGSCSPCLWTQYACERTTLSRKRKEKVVLGFCFFSPSPISSFCRAHVCEQGCADEGPANYGTTNLQHFFFYISTIFASLLMKRGAYLAHTKAKKITNNFFFSTQGTKYFGNLVFYFYCFEKFGENVLEL